MTNVVMIARDRPRLTEQTLESLRENTGRDSFNLTIVDDGSEIPACADWLEHWDEDVPTQLVQLHCPIGIVGFARNLGVLVAEKHFGRGDWLYFTDNDVYFKPGWLEKMTIAASVPPISILGGCRHPYHQANRVIPVEIREPIQAEVEVQTVDAVAGYSMLMRWGTWDAYGPFDAHAKGVGQSEDWALCQKAVRAGYKVGYIHPPVLINCGLTNTLGEKVPGWEQFEMVEGVVQE